MSSGYIHSGNEYTFPNLKITGTMCGAGQQLTFQRQEKGPVIHLISKNLAKNDLIKIEKYNGDEIFRIGNEGDVYVNGIILQNNLEPDANVLNNIESRKGVPPPVISKLEKRDDIILERNNTKWKVSISDDGNLLFMKFIDGNWIEKHCVG